MHCHEYIILTTPNGFARKSYMGPIIMESSIACYWTHYCIIQAQYWSSEFTNGHWYLTLMSVLKVSFFSMSQRKKKSHYFITSGHCTADTRIRGAEWIIRLLTHWGWDKRAAILQTTFSNAFSWMKMYEISSRFWWSLFLRVQLTIFQNWQRW